MILRFIFFSIVALVGFESSSYTVNESDGTVEVCIVVTNPPAGEPLIFILITQHSTRSGTAGKKRTNSPYLLSMPHIM